MADGSAQLPAWRSSVHENVMNTIWHKLVANVAINGMSALLETKNGFVDGNQYAHEAARMLVEEAIRRGERLRLHARPRRGTGARL